MSFLLHSYKKGKNLTCGQLVFTFSFYVHIICRFLQDTDYFLRLAHQAVKNPKYEHGILGESQLGSAFVSVPLSSSSQIHWIIIKLVWSNAAIGYHSTPSFNWSFGRGFESKVWYLGNMYSLLELKRKKNVFWT